MIISEAHHCDNFTSVNSICTITIFIVLYHDYMVAKLHLTVELCSLSGGTAYGRTAPYNTQSYLTFELCHFRTRRQPKHSFVHKDISLKVKDIMMTKSKLLLPIDH